MSTLLITTPGMGKTYLVKEMKRNGVLALDFDIKGSKPDTEEAWIKVRKANSLYINAAFDAGYEYVTAWPNSVDLESLSKDIRIVFVVPVGDAWTGCMLRIAARQPGTPFINDMMDRYHDLIDQLEGMYLDAMNTHDNVSKVIVTNAHDTLTVVWGYLSTTGYSGGAFLDVKAKFSPSSAVEAILPKHCKVHSDEIFHKCLSPELVSDITSAIDRDGDLSHFETNAYGFGMFSFCHLSELEDYISDSATIRRIQNTCGDYYCISTQTLIERDEMGDWYSIGYTFLKHHA